MKLTRIYDYLCVTTWRRRQRGLGFVDLSLTSDKQSSGDGHHRDVEWVTVDCLYEDTIGHIYIHIIHIHTYIYRKDIPRFSTEDGDVESWASDVNSVDLWRGSQMTQIWPTIPLTFWKGPAGLWKSLGCEDWTENVNQGWRNCFFAAPSNSSARFHHVPRFLRWISPKITQTCRVVTRDQAVFCKGHVFLKQNEQAEAC